MKHLDGQFKGRDELNLYYQCWLPDAPKAILLVVHGLAEHSGRYGNLVNYLVTRGYGVYGYDQRGHGKSEGLRGYVDRFSDYLDDLGIFIHLVHARHQGLKIFMVGHSMGGTIVLADAIRHQNEFDGLVLSGALLETPTDVSAVTIMAARFLSLVLPKTGLYVIDAKLVSQDQKVVEAYAKDPLVYQGKIRARLGVELLKAMDMVKCQLSRIHLPILVMYGSVDRLSSPEGSQLIYEQASSTDKTLKAYEGFYHEIFNEPGHELVLADVDSWLKSRV